MPSYEVHNNVHNDCMEAKTIIMEGIQQISTASCVTSGSWEHFAKDALAVNNHMNDEK